MQVAAYPAKRAGASEPLGGLERSTHEHRPQGPLFHRHDVEAYRPPPGAGPRQQGRGDQRQPLLLAVVHGLESRVQVAAQLHLDDREHLAFGRNDVDFAATGADVARQDTVALSLQRAHGRVLPFPAEEDAAPVALRPGCPRSAHVPIGARRVWSGNDGEGINAAFLQAPASRGTTRAMDLTDADVRKVAALARLGLTDAEVAALRGDLNGILDYVAKLSELDTDDVEPTSHVVAIASALRPDEVTSRPAPEDAVANAPRREETFFVVPSIIE